MKFYLEVSELLVVAGHLSLTLIDLDLDLGLTVGGGGIGFSLLGGDGGVSHDELVHLSAHDFDTEGEWGDIKKEDVGNVTSEDTSLNGGTNGDSFIRVDGLRWCLSEDLFGDALDLWHSGHATDEKDVVDLALGELGVLDRLVAWLDSSLDELVDNTFELCSSDLQVQVLGASSVHSKEGKVDVGLGRAGKFNLRVFSGFLDSLDGLDILGDVDSALLLKLSADVVDESIVKVLTAEKSVTVGRFDFEDTLLDFEDGDIEGSSSEIIDGDDFIFVLVETVGEGSGGGLVDDSENVKTGDLDKT